jgi:hypothetical protein
MVDKSHCKLPYDGLHPEVADFYACGDCAEDGDGDDDAAWEDVDDAEDIATIEEELSAGSQLVSVETAATRRATGLAARGVAMEAAAGGDTTVPELILEDGRRLGHRSLVRYFKQSVRPDELPDHQLIANLITSYRNMGHEMVTRTARKPSSQVLWVTKAERKEQAQMLKRVSYDYQKSRRSFGFHYNGVDDSGHARKV